MDPRIAEWKKKDVYWGTSSWKYGGWMGLVYNEDYPSDKAFQNDCLLEYARHYTAVGVDHTYYAYPSPAMFARYVDQTPEDFRFGLKVTEAITVMRYPKLKRYGKLAGLDNPDFLSAEKFHDEFLKPLEPYKGRLGPLMLEFSQFYPGMIASGSEFVERLDRFFDAVGKDTGFTFGIEMRNRGWLKTPYFDALTRHGVAHVFNSWTRMPSLSEQLDAAGSFKPPCYVARLLLKPGTQYEDAVEAYSPYDKVQEELPQVRQDTAQMVETAVATGVRAYVFVNNRLEGCAPLTILGILDRLEQARLRTTAD